MAPRGYTDATLVADALGVTLTAGQIATVPGLVESAEALIDRYTGRSWLVSSPATGETHPVVGGVVYLDRRPVATVTAVTVRSRAIGATATTLAAGTGYELLDAARGILAVGDYGDDAIVSVSYTHTTPYPLPADVRLAATWLVADWLAPRLDPTTAGGLVESISVGQGDIAIKYRGGSSGDGTGMPDRVAAILRSYRRLVFA